MSYSFTDNTKKIEDDISIKASVFLRKLCDEVISIAEPNTPKDRGNLRADVIKQVLGLKSIISWGKNYAIYQETKQFKNYTTPGTGPHFAENAVNEAIKKSDRIAKSAGLI